jgi:diacylglycerol kinase family enzyme
VPVTDIALIVNPFASRVDEERIEAVRGALAAAGEVRLLRTERARHATELATSASREGAGAIVVFSGDGGFNEVLNGADGTVPLGFVPGGGTSVLPRALGLPRDPVRAASQIAEALTAERTRRISLGRVNGTRFAFEAGIGFDAETVRRVDQLGRDESGRRPGDLTFVKTVLQLVTENNGRFPPMLEIKGLGRAAFAIVANTDPTTFAGPLPIRFAPQARFELGLDVTAPIELRKRRIPRFLAASLLGRGFGRKSVLFGHDLDRIEIVCDSPLPLQADGEDLGDVTEGLFECERGAVSVLV